MKTVLIALLALVSSSSAFAAPDYYGMCRTELQKVANGLSSYLATQSDECKQAADQGQAGRGQINQVCTNPGQIGALYNRAVAVCGQCRRLNNAQINAACNPGNGASAFIDAANSL